MNNKAILTIGYYLLDAPYNVSLRRTVLRCLAYDFRERPTPRELGKVVEHALGLFEEEVLVLETDSPGIKHPEPIDDPGGHSGGEIWRAMIPS